MSPIYQDGKVILSQRFTGAIALIWQRDNTKIIVHGYNLSFINQIGRCPTFYQHRSTNLEKYMGFQRMKVNV